MAQFVSEDPIGFAAGDANLRRYVGNSMPNAVDPTGLEELQIDESGDVWVYPESWWSGINYDSRRWKVGTAFTYTTPGGAEYLLIQTDKVLTDIDGNEYRVVLHYEDFEEYIRWWFTSELARKLPRRALPVAILALLGVSLNYQGQKLGDLLLAQALRDCHGAGQTFAFVAVILNCVDDRAKAFYQRWDFAELPGSPLHRAFSLVFSSLWLRWVILHFCSTPKWVTAMNSPNSTARIQESVYFPKSSRCFHLTAGTTKPVRKLY